MNGAGDNSVPERRQKHGKAASLLGRKSGAEGRNGGREKLTGRLRKAPGGLEAPRTSRSPESVAVAGEGNDGVRRQQGSPACARRRRGRRSRWRSDPAGRGGAGGTVAVVATADGSSCAREERIERGKRERGGVMVARVREEDEGARGNLIGVAEAPDGRQRGRRRRVGARGRQRAMRREMTSRWAGLILFH
jgi:hypothetical protein